MNGIDTSAAALLAGRIGALSPPGSQGSAGAAQTGVSALTGGVDALADPRNAGSPQASAQTVLSAVALALDAIIRSGGEATPAVVGRAPVWADPSTAGAAQSGDANSLPLPGLSNNPAGQAGAAAQAGALEATLLAGLASGIAQAGLPGGAQGADGADGAAGAGSANGANGANGADGAANGGTAGAQGAASSSLQGTQAAQGAALAAQSGPVAALAAALAQTVASSGLFYESHLAQWLRGQRTPGELADEPQNRLTGGAQLPLDWSPTAHDIDDVLWTDLPSAAQQGARVGSMANAAGAGVGTSSAHGEANAAFAHDAARAGGSAALLADTLLPAARTAAGAGAGVGVHEALLPLVRQQLDLLATGEFRWTGEAWPGVRLDWTIQQDDDERRDAPDPRPGRAVDDDETAWRTRLTLALPALGTVDAELTLAGSTLAVRVQASPGGAQRLTAHSEALRGRLEALGLALAGLSIREIGGMSGAAGVDGARAAGAYARAAATHVRDAQGAGPVEAWHHADAAPAAASAAASAVHAADAPHAMDSTDWELG
ncbi:flagellar hook-length control protein FliK [Paraburkholderia tagetis]|uniref:Flagellar hook-length control protein FliK n=1 Tax=Paraburkholderia tagetis TaxID=2913261 RepID=A0A9X1UID2_9BURK|nr:flagellar hook-length control protein FliK [Paraburkholderia tagetis]MCG5075008.1 flagellar hook-length control protein FliK [Paraburkholderia tagetis]